MIKKFLIILLSLVMVFSITACGSPDYDDEDDEEAIVLDNVMNGEMFGPDTPVYEYGMILDTQSSAFEDCYAVNKSESEEALQLYIEKLISEGYKETYKKQIESNTFTRYSNGEFIITIMETPALEYQVRIAIEREGMQCESDLTSDRTTSDHTTTLTMVGQNMEKKYGMGYIFRLADGRFICIDGGYSNNDSAKWFYEEMQRLTPEGEDIVIAAWILTHAHDDHCGTFVDFTTRYRKNVTLEKIMYNFGMDHQFKTSGQNYTYYDKSLLSAKGSNYRGVQNILTHPGNSYDFGGLTIDFIYTSELMVGSMVSSYNDISTVFTVNTEGQKYVFLGDSNSENAPVMLKMYTEQTLAGDVMQIAHHGYASNAMDETLYTTINPSYVLWPSSLVNFNTSAVQKHVANRWVLDTIPHENIWIAGEAVIRLTLPVSAENYEVFENTDEAPVHPEDK